MKIRELTIDDIQLDLSFSPIREIILFDDNEWEKFVNDDSQLNLACVENLFASNEIFPGGMSGPFKEELGKFLAYIDTFQISINFLISLSENKHFISILRDFNMAIQNFMIYLNIRSYYSAFMEFRKVLEGILWMQEIHANRTIPKIITNNEYALKLSNIHPKFGELYSLLNNLFHYNENTPAFNINRIYKQKDHLFIYLSKIDEITDLFEQQAEIFINTFTNVTMKRYSIILKKLYKARDVYDLRNFPIKKSNQNNFGIGQEKFANLLLKPNKYKMMDFIGKYKEGIDENVGLFESGSQFNQYDNAILWLNNSYNGKFEKYSTYLNSAFLSFARKEQNSIFLHMPGPESIYAKCREICCKLLELEIKEGGSLKCAILRSHIEDLAFNARRKKHNFFANTSVISDILKSDFDIKISKLPRKHSHLLRDDGIKYLRYDQILSKDAEIVNPNELEKTFEYLNKLNNHIDKLLSNII